MKNLNLAACVAATLPLSAPASAMAADAARAYPVRPVRLIMGPGGPTDSVGRVFATRLTELWGETVVVENRPGAGNTIATAAAAKATPDGYTLLLCPISDAVAPALYKKLPYDFVKDITAISHIGVTPNVFVVPPSQPVKTIKEFIAHAKANPGKLDYGGLGVGQSGQRSECRHRRNSEDAGCAEAHGKLWRRHFIIDTGTIRRLHQIGNAALGESGESSRHPATIGQCNENFDERKS